jgi:transketolase
MEKENPMHERLVEHSLAVKKRFLEMYKRANAGHVGSALSCSEILTFVRFGWMQDGDTLVLSKGHAAAVLYSLLVEEGSMQESSVQSFCQDATVLSAHPPVNQLPNVPFATGSLGHGLSLVAGMAMGCRFNGKKRTFFCVTSDGELDEGSIWEAALFISHHRFDNIIWMIDRNGLQGIGRTEEVLALEPLEEKLKAFGFFVTTADGHDFGSLEHAKNECITIGFNQPKVIVCKTIKGRGLGALQNTVDCHYLPMSEDQYRSILKEIEQESRISTSGRQA